MSQLAEQWQTKHILPLRCILYQLIGAQRCEVHAASQLQKGVTDILITCICQLYSFVMGEQQELSMFVLQVVEWACIVAPVNTYTHPHSPLHTPPALPHTRPRTPTPIPPTHPHTLITAFFKHTLHITE